MRAVTFGEGMIELSGQLGREVRVQTGGDMLNAAIMLTRLGARTSLLSALGCDAWSDGMLASWTAEGLDTSSIVRHPTRLPGLYAIAVSEAGERSFSYWRSDSAARAFWQAPGHREAIERIMGADLLLLSGITLSLFDEEGIDATVELMARFRSAGGKVAFDPNYRARGWSSPARAAAAFSRIAPCVDIALPSREDEILIHGEISLSEIAQRWASAGEVVIKLGGEGAWIPATGELIPIPSGGLVVDTTGAGDSFDAGYCYSRLSGASPQEAVRVGQRMASIAIQHPGGIPPRIAYLSTCS